MVSLPWLFIPPSVAVYAVNDVERSFCTLWGGTPLVSLPWLFILPSVAVYAVNDVERSFCTL